MDQTSHGKLQGETVTEGLVAAVCPSGVRGAAPGARCQLA